MTGGRGLELVDVSVGYRYRFHPVAEHISAVARPGEVTALLGPNGMGKSTLLRTIAGLQPAGAGRVLHDGADLLELPQAVRARKQAVVLTERVTPGTLSVRDVVLLGRYPHTSWRGVPGPRDEEVAQWALAAVGAEHLAMCDVSELSDGQRQRAMIARALAQEPELLLLDEPSAFLDAPSRVQLMGLLRRLAQEQGMVIVVSTHEVELALRTADHLWLLDRQARLHDVTPEEAALSGLIGAVFDSAELGFDAAAGSFHLTPVTVGDAVVSGVYAAVVARLAQRHRWRVEVTSAGLAQTRRGAWWVHGTDGPDPGENIRWVVRPPGGQPRDAGSLRDLTTVLRDAATGASKAGQ